MVTPRVSRKEREAAMYFRPELLLNGARVAASVSGGRTLMTRTAIVLISVVVILAAVPSHMAAQVSLSFTPMLIEMTAAPGETRAFEVVMMNEGRAMNADFLIYTADLAQKANGDYEVLDVGTSERSCAKWIKLSADKASIGPGETFAVRGTLTVPRGASGGRYAAVVFELIPEPRKGGPALASSTFVQRFATVVELSIPARQVQKRLDVTGFSVAHASENPAYASAYGKQAVILSAEVKNEGSIHVFARGSMILRDAAGKRLREIPLGAGRGIVIPGATVNLGSVLPAGLAPGDYVADISVKYGGLRPTSAKIPFGIRGSGAQAARAETTAVIAPFSVDPGDFDLSYPAGATAAKSLVLENQSDQAIRVEGCAMPLAFDEEGELVTGEVALSASSCAGWIELKPNVVEIKPRSRQVVRMMISIPRGESGGKYANVVFTATPVSPDKGQTWSGESGAVVSLRVGKEFSTLGKLSPVTMEDGGPSVGMVFGTIFENTGTIHVKPRASMTIKKRVMPESVPGIEYVGPGSLVEVNSIDLGEEENVVLPGGRRLFNVALSGGLEPGDYVVEFLVNYGGKSPLYVMREFTVK